MNPNSFSKTRGAEQLLRLPEVLRLFPVSRSAWYFGVRSGTYPSPVRIGARSVAWRLRDVQALIDTCSGRDRAIDSPDGL
jgi:prophage regulatory protein